MQEQRMARLHQMLQETPEDPFLLYALALEYRKFDLTQAISWFDKLLVQHPHYLPTYYHAAAALIEAGKAAEAKTVYQKGIALAQEQQESHSLRELRNAYQNLLVDLDEL